MSIQVPLRLQPEPVEKVWGGEDLATRVAGLEPSTRPIGEAWSVSDREERANSVVGGAFDGRSLRGLMLSEREALLGSARTSASGGFPLLVKFLEAAQDLSVQVHPDRAAADRLRSESKEECWYIVRAEPGAVVYLGLAEGVDAREFAEKAPSADVVSLLEKQPVAAGDFVHVPAGTVHAVGAGISLVEVQESSDTTYRIYDWGRVGLNGQPRETHLDEALTAIDFGSRPAAPVHAALEALRSGDSADRSAELVVCPSFRVELLEVNRSADVGEDDLPVVLVVLSGAGKLKCEGLGEPLDLQAGESWLVPADAARVRLEEPSGELVVLRAVPAKKDH